MNYQEVLRGLIEHGKEAGYLTYEEISQKLPEINFSIRARRDRLTDSV